jgi:hypothetical protein
MSTDADAGGGSSASFVRTTIALREDIYQKLKRRGGSLSDEVNDILAREFVRDHSLFGSAKRVRRDDVRDRSDRV